MLPVLLCFALLGLAVAAFVAWVASDLDVRSLDRQAGMIDHVLRSQLLELSHDQESLAVWDDAVTAVSDPVDRDWMDQNYVQWTHNFNGHDRVIVLNRADHPIHAGNQGSTVYVGLVVDDIVAMQPLLDRLRRELRTDGQSYLQSGRSSEVPRVADFAIIDDMPAIVSLMPIVSDSGEIAQPAGSEAILVSVQLLDHEFAHRLITRYMIAEGRFRRSPLPGAGATHPVIGSDGRIVAVFEWDPDRPGQAFVSRTFPVLVLAFVIGALLVGWLLHRLWRASRELESGRLAAQHQANHDALTGLANRLHFDEILGRTVLDRRGHVGGVAVLMLDLDRFKQVNDTLGHQSGDDLIRAVGVRLRALVSTDDTLARLGGDEFAIIHHSPEGLAGHIALSNRVIDAVNRPFEILGSEVFVGVSIGIVVIGEGDEDRREVVRKADIALYEAKSAGRNQSAIYQEEMDALLQNRHRIEAELREALRGGDQLSVAFQPLLGSESGRIDGAEALVRWSHPVLGRISPAHFVPVAESTGLIEAVGDLVLQQAAKLGARYPGRTIAVNISPVQLRNPKFVERLLDCLLDAGMAPADLEIEITESILLDNGDVAATALRSLRGAGVRIALDDFGTGYSSLNYLKRYPVDRIKIDRSFVAQLEDGNVSVEIVRAMMTLAHALRIEVTAEGVETEEQKRILTQLGCNTFQGFLISPPVPEPEIHNYLRDTSSTVRVA